jgi:hypothetical protein
VFLSVLHPLVRQAARFLEITEPKYCTLAVRNDDVPPGIYAFALYRWAKHGIRPDESLVPVVTHPQLEDRLLAFLQSATDTDTAASADPGVRDALDARHHTKWVEARADHIRQNQQMVAHRIQSLSVSHRARCAAIQDQISRATNEKIRLMKESELARAKTDFDLRMADLEQAANSGDIRATPVVFGTLLLTGEGER